MKLINSLFIAFSTYSAIPVPHADWKKENMQYSMCFFPLIGVVTGLLLFVWQMLSSFMEIGHGLFAAVAVLLPIAVSGGIHLDGFCDTMDALASHQPKERKLEILKDSHTGAFAVIGCVLYLLLQFGLWTELMLEWKSIFLIGIGFILSRSLSGLAVVMFPCAKNSGILAAFSVAAVKKNVRGIMLCYLVLCTASLVIINLIAAVVLLVVSSLCYFCYYQMSKKQFGGITGDLAGFFLQGYELFVLLAVVLVQKI